ncbi:MAG: hypothetical protein PWQ68_2631, partial [Thermoanaerobacteraceae bacterium]|nr:hypothetical protein [Thermoanaerobacteraceae bacterium]
MIDDNVFVEEKQKQSLGEVISVV